MGRKLAILCFVVSFCLSVQTFGESLASYELDETSLTLMPASWDTGLTLAIVQGGTSGAPAATEGDYVLKLNWTGETDLKFEFRHQWSGFTFDLDGRQRILFDVYIADQNPPAVIGVWDDVFGWHGALSLPPQSNQWFTIEADVSACSQTGLDHIAAFVFENAAADSGTLYIDNLRTGYDSPAVSAEGHDRRIDLVWDPVILSSLAGYNIYRSSSPSGPFTKLNSSVDDITVYSDFVGANDQTYYYSVAAVSDAAVESYQPPVVSAATFAMTDNQFLSSIQQATVRYFWDFAHPVSGMARERSDAWDRDTVTTGGSGFGIMAILVGVERGWIDRDQAAVHILKIAAFLDDTALRYHGVWSHWMNGNTGQPIAFDYDSYGNPVICGDLVETSFMIQGLLTAREYFDADNAVENELRSRVTDLYEDVEWDFYRRTSDTDGSRLYWLWSPTHNWDISFPIAGYNECVVSYVLAIGSPTHSIPASCYFTGWAGNPDYVNGNTYYGYPQWAGVYELPMFWTHYSYLGFDPRNLTDGICNYFYNSRNIALIDRAYCAANPNNYTGYSSLAWGLSNSQDPAGYAVHAPGSYDNGTITPTAAIGSMPFTPAESMATLKHLYTTYGSSLWGPFGFKDAFNLTQNWFSEGYLAIDQGPIPIMIENYRTGLCWDLFMSNPEISTALDAIGIIILDPENMVLASYEPSETGLSVAPAAWDSGLTLTTVAGGSNGAPIATEGSYVLKLDWTGETDRKIQIDHQWGNLTFDLAGYEKIKADVYIAESSAMPGLMGVWDDIFGWNQAESVPTVTGQWVTVSIDISSREEVCLKRIAAFIFENLSADSGTIYMDNLRLTGPHAVHFPMRYAQKQQAHYSGAACLKMALDREGENDYTQDDLHSYGKSQNSAANQAADFIDPQGMYLAMNHFELNSYYNYSAMSDTTIEAAFYSICYWIEYDIPAVEAANMPAMIPLGGNYDHWTIVNGFSASADPWVTSTYTVNGFWITDPSVSGIGENVYITASELASDYTVMSTSDSWNGTFVSVCEPPLSSGEVTIARPARYKDKLSRKDYAAAARKGLEEMVLPFDKRFELAYIGSEAGQATAVRSERGHYVIVPFLKDGGCTVAVIIDAADGTFRQASFCEQPDGGYVKQLAGKGRLKRHRGRNAFLPLAD